MASAPRDEMMFEGAIRRYFAACNAADRDVLVSCFVPDAVHYFPRGSSFGTVRTAAAIADLWIECVSRWDSVWTIDRLIVHAASQQAVIEWTHFQPRRNFYLRGDEWYCFDEAGLITEIRAYYAAPSQKGVEYHDLDGYPYEEMGYAMAPPDIGSR